MMCNETERSLHLVVEIFISVVLWTCTYKVVLKCFPNKKPEWSCRIISTLHGIIAIFMSGWVFVVGPSPFGPPSAVTNSGFHNNLLIVSLGYFIFDTTWCLYHKTEGMAIVTHHVASVITMTCVLLSQECVVNAVSALGFGECTNPLLQLRWFLRELKIKSTIIPLVVDLSFCVLFLICRFIFIIALSYYLIMDPKVRIFFKLMTLILDIVSVIFMYQIIQAAQKTRMRHKKAHSL